MRVAQSQVCPYWGCFLWPPSFPKQQPKHGFNEPHPKTHRIYFSEYLKYPVPSKRYVFERICQRIDRFLEDPSKLAITPSLPGDWSSIRDELRGVVRQLQVVKSRKGGWKTGMSFGSKKNSAKITFWMFDNTEQKMMEFKDLPLQKLVSDRRI